MSAAPPEAFSRTFLPRRTRKNVRPLTLNPGSAPAEKRTMGALFKPAAATFRTRLSLWAVVASLALHAPNAAATSSIACPPGTLQKVLTWIGFKKQPAPVTAPKNLLPRLGKYDHIHTDLFSIVGEVTPPGRKETLLTVQLDHGAIADTRKFFSYDDPAHLQGDVITDFRILPKVLGEKGARFFGYAVNEAAHQATIPTTAALNEAIDLFNRRVTQLAPGQAKKLKIPITFYETPGTFMSKEEYVQRFRDFGQLPISGRYRMFFHDITSHSMEGFFIDHRIFEIVQQNLHNLEDVTKAARSGKLGLSDSALEAFEKGYQEMIEDAASQIDRLGMGGSDFLSPADKTHLRDIGYQRGRMAKERAKPEDFRNSTGQGVTSSLGVDDLDFYSLLDADNAKTFEELLKPMSERDREILLRELAKHPKPRLDYDLNASLKQLDQLEDDKKLALEERSRHLRENPITRPGMERLELLQKIVAQPR